MTYKTATISYETRVHTFWTLALLFIISVGMYIYSVNAAIRNTVARQNLEAEAAHLSAELGTLEFEYIELRNNIDIELAYQYGFQEAKDPIYISRVPGSALTLNTR